MRRLRNNINRVVLLILFFGLSWSCVEKDIDPSDPSAAFVRARESYDNEMFEIAIQKLGEFKSRFPYSKHAPDAELLIADSHYQLGHYAEAASAYELFVKLHPKHEKADFAQYRVGESYWAEAPEEVDREQEYTLKAIAEWEKLLVTYPEGEWSKKAKNLLDKGQRRVAEHAEFIAKFYCKQRIYHACAFRYIELSQQFPQFTDLTLKAYENAALAFDKLSKNFPKEDPIDTNLYFKSMTPEELSSKATELRAKAVQLREKTN